MTKKRKTNEKFLPKLKAKLAKLVFLLVSLMTIGTWFTAILFMAVNLGEFVHWAEIAYPSTPKWMFNVAHYIEYGMFVIDCICLIYAVLKELKEHFSDEEDDDNEESEEKKD